jgi:hypothetical protein
MNLKKFLWTLSGDDLSIIEKCSKPRQMRFAIIGSFVLFIFIMCFISSYFTFTMIFHNYIFGIPASIFFSWMITNIYLLLLYTLTKNVLPHKKSLSSRVISLFLRLGFITFIAIFISKPIEVLLFSNQLPKEIDAYKSEQIEKYTTSTIAYFNDETKDLQGIIRYQKAINADTVSAETIRYSKLNAEKTKSIENIEKIVNNSNYYIKGIVILNSNYPICWLISAICIFIFLTPALLKRLIEFDSTYYKLKKKIKTNIILEEYAKFKEQYYQLLLQDYNRNLTYTELYVDPPIQYNSKKGNHCFFK